MSQLRNSILAEEELVASKSRFGLFSQPPPLAIGDNAAFKPIQHRRGENGKPMTNPPQLLAGSCKTGKNKSSYFQVPESIYSNDLYKDKFKADIEYQRKMHTKGTLHEADFKPASGAKTSAVFPYAYQQQKSGQSKEVIKDENGKVKTEQRNFTTNPISKVETQFFKPPKHISDPFERKKQFEKKQRQSFIKKLPVDTPAFKSMSSAKKTLNKDKTVYGEDEEAKLKMSRRKERVKTVTSLYPHESKFKLARLGFGDPIGQFPKGIEKFTNQSIDMPKKRIKTEEAKETWKPNKFKLSRPTPSISYHPSNMKASRYK